VPPETWLDLFQVPGSSTGAIAWYNSSRLRSNLPWTAMAMGRIDFFDPEDAILSVAHYLVAHGWDGQPQHQQRAIYAYYGGHYSADPNKYYMKRC